KAARPRVRHMAHGGGEGKHANGIVECFKNVEGHAPAWTGVDPRELVPWWVLPAGRASYPPGPASRRPDDKLSIIRRPRPQCMRYCALRGSRNFGWDCLRVLT